MIKGCFFIHLKRLISTETYTFKTLETILQPPRNIRTADTFNSLSKNFGLGEAVVDVVAVYIHNHADYNLKLMEIRLSEKAWGHISTRHPEVSFYKSEIIEAVKGPDTVLKGSRGEFKAIKYLSRTHLGPKHLVVVYKVVNEEKHIITAYFTSDLGSVRGEVVWKK
ncbi:MAG: hypothetical protein QW318_05305 [Candidatus Caldarchaeum sp.]|uniref:DUF4258 domain-containing protein n=1 Tax=Caldiarchaeum subterraneum TaxID=311458 RepID=A0A7J3WAP3_CALS0